jgi:hypothetical protein
MEKLYSLKSEVLEETYFFIQKVKVMSDTILFDASIDVHTRFPRLDVLEKITQEKDDWKSRMRNLLLAAHITETMAKAGYNQTTITVNLEELFPRPSDASPSNESSAST